MVNLPEEDMFHSREELLADAHRRQEERIAYEVCEDCARDNVIYFETRFAPALASNEKFTMEGAVVAALYAKRRRNARRIARPPDRPQSG